MLENLDATSREVAFVVPVAVTVPVDDDVLPRAAFTTEAFAVASILGSPSATTSSRRPQTGTL